MAQWTYRIFLLSYWVFYKNTLHMIHDQVVSLNFTAPWSHHCFGLVRIRINVPFDKLSGKCRELATWRIDQRITRISGSSVPPQSFVLALSWTLQILLWHISFPVKLLQWWKPVADLFRQITIVLFLLVECYCFLEGKLWRSCEAHLLVLGV